MILIFKNLPRIVCSLTYVLSLRMFHVHLKIIYILLLSSIVVYICLLGLIVLHCLKSSISLLIFRLDILSIIKTGVWKSPTIIGAVLYSFRGIFCMYKETQIYDLSMNYANATILYALFCTLLFLHVTYFCIFLCQ